MTKKQRSWPPEVADEILAIRKKIEYLDRIAHEKKLPALGKLKVKSKAKLK